jgi:hypothetical protein
MSEVDRLSNSGLYPALPIGDKRRDGSPGKPPSDPDGKKPAGGVDNSDPTTPRTPKSIIDEYA